MFDLPPPVPAIEIVVSNEGVSKGLQETDGAQVRGTLELGMGAFTIGTSLKNQDGTDGDLESETYIGVTKKIAGFDVGAQVAYKANVRNAPKGGDNEAVEFEGSIARTFGPVTGKVSHTYSPNDLGYTGRSHYTAGLVGVKMGGMTVSGGVGRRDREFAADYTAYNAGVTLHLMKGINLDTRYYTTNKSELGEEYGKRIVVSLGARF